MTGAADSTSSSCVGEGWWREIASALKPWRMKLKITWYLSSPRLMCNDPAWLTLKKLFLWTDSLTLNILALIRPTASNIAYLLFRLSLDLISSHLWGKKNKLKCWLWLFSCCCVLMVDIWGFFAFTPDDKHNHSMSKPPSVALIKGHYPKITLMVLTYS